jgi:hypothetical protein
MAMLNYQRVNENIWRFAKSWGYPIPLIPADDFNKRAGFLQGFS